MYKYVPSKYPSTRFDQAWCNRDVRRLPRRKKRHTKKHESDLMRYKQVQKDAHNTCRNAHNDYIRNMVSEPGSKNKQLFSYVKGLKCDISGVATLKKDGTNYSKACDKAEILNDQFASAFTREDHSNMPSMENSLKSEPPPLVNQEDPKRSVCISLHQRRPQQHALHGEQLKI